MSEWISVKDKLPKRYMTVLTWEKALRPELGFEPQYQLAARFSSGEWCQRSGQKYYEITHWMPLPEPPKESK